MNDRLGTKRDAKGAKSYLLQQNTGSCGEPLTYYPKTQG